MKNICVLLVALCACSCAALAQVDLSDSNQVKNVLTVPHGGTGSANPHLTAGTGITITGTWPFNTITNSGSTIGYPPAGVPSSTGSAWGSSYTVGTGASNLVQLDSSGRLPAVSAANLTNFPTLNQNTTGNAATATQLSATPTLCATGQAPTGILPSGNATGCEPITAVYPGAGVANSTGSAWGTSYQVGTAANNLVQLDVLGRLPAVSGANLTNLPFAPQVYPPAGVPNSTGSSWGTSYAVGTGANNLVQLTSSGQLPAVSGALLTNLPSTPQVYPAAGIANSTGTAWGASYAVGTGSNSLVQLNSIGQLPAVSAALLTNFPTFNQSTTGNAATATNISTTGSNGTFWGVSSGVQGWYTVSGSSGVASWDGRTGVVVPQSGDYTASQVTGAVVNTTSVNGHPLSANVTIVATDITSGVFSTAQIPSLNYCPLGGCTLTGNLLFSPTNNLSIGTSSGNQPSAGYFGTLVQTPSVILPSSTVTTPTAGQLWNNSSGVLNFYANSVTYSLVTVQGAVTSGDCPTFSGTQGLLQDTGSPCLFGSTQTGASGAFIQAVGGNTTNQSLLNPTETNPTDNQVTVSGGTGPTQLVMNYNTSGGSCNTPAGGTSFLCTPASNDIEASVNGSVLTTPPIQMASTAFSTTSTSLTNISGLTSISIAAGQYVVLDCAGQYSIATAVDDMTMGINASVAPASIQYDGLITIGSTTQFSLTSVTNNGALTPTTAVGAINTNYPWKIHASMTWGSSAGTFSVRAATGSASHAVTIVTGASCVYNISN